MNTSRMAWDSIRPSVTELQMRVLRTLRAAPYGLAFHELEELLPDLTGSTVRTRCNELVKLGHVMHTDEIRRTRSGRAAAVWQAR